MGCCLAVIVGMVWPRLALAYVYFFTGIPGTVFKTTLWPVLGFFFLPTTTLAYELCVYYGHGPMENNIWCLLIVFLAFLHDLGQLGATRSRRREK